MASPDEKNCVTQQLVIQALLAEYNALRAEIIETIRNRITIITFSFGGASIFVVGLLSSKLNTLIAGSLLLSVVPMALKAVLIIWLGEYYRCRRAEALVCRIENRVNSIISQEDIMMWVGYVHSSKKSMLSPYLASIAFIALPNYISICVGLTLLIPEISRSSYVGVGFTLFLTIIIEIGYSICISYLWRNIRNEAWNPMQTSLAR